MGAASVTIWLLVSLVAFAAAATRTYYISAEEIEWNYFPLGYDVMTGKSYNDSNISLRKRDGIHAANVSTTHGHGAATYVTATNHTIGRRHKKAVYREYTDDKFTTYKPVTPEWAHLGLLGPVIRAEVGDTIQVFFRNMATRPYSIHPHGVQYTRSNAGVPLPNSIGLDGNLVPPGEAFMYTWQVPERAGPGPKDPSSILWMYHSHVDEVADTNAGLIGPLIITRKGDAQSPRDPTPRDVSREMIICFNIYDENESPYLNDSVLAYMPAQPQSDADWATLMADATFVEGNKKHTINGLLYANVVQLNMTTGERVRWYVFGLGSETDVHGVHWHGQTLLHKGSRVDVTEVIPASMRTLDMEPDNPGLWMLHCHTNHHIHAGMYTLFQVDRCAKCTPPPTLNAATAAIVPHAVALLLGALMFIFAL